MIFYKAESKQGIFEEAQKIKTVKVDFPPILMSILEVAAFKSIDLTLQVCEGVADLSPATYLEKTICMQVGPKKVRLLSGELLDALLFRSNCNECKRPTSSASSCLVSMLVTPCLAAILEMLL